MATTVKVLDFKSGIALPPSILPPKVSPKAPKYPKLSPRADPSSSRSEKDHPSPRYSSPPPGGGLTITIASGAGTGTGIWTGGLSLDGGGEGKPFDALGLPSVSSPSNIKVSFSSHSPRPFIITTVDNPFIKPTLLQTVVNEGDVPVSSVRAKERKKSEYMLRSPKYIKPLWSGQQAAIASSTPNNNDDERNNGNSTSDSSTMLNLDATNMSINTSCVALHSPRGKEGEEEEEDTASGAGSPYNVPAYSLAHMENKIRHSYIELQERSRVLNESLVVTKKDVHEITDEVYTLKADARSQLPTEWLREHHPRLLQQKAAKMMYTVIDNYLKQVTMRRLTRWVHFAQSLQGEELNRWFKKRAATKLCKLFDSRETKMNPIRVHYAFAFWYNSMKAKIRRERRKAAREIQRKVRLWLAKKKELRKRQLLLLKTISSLQIQRVWRGYKGRLRAAARRQYLLEMKSAGVIQKHWRRFMYCRKIQAWVRCRLQRKKYVKWRTAYIKFQAVFRGHCVRQRRFRAAVSIQRLWKGRKQRYNYRRARGCREIQKIFRGHIKRRAYKIIIKGVIWQQSQWRMLKKRRWYKIAVVDYRDMLARQALLKIQERLARKASTIHSEARKIEGVTIAFRIYRHSREAVTVLAYDCRCSFTYKFVFLESQIRKIAETELGEEIQDRNDLYKKSNIILLINKFVWSRGKVESDRKLVVTEKGRGERGKKIRRFGKRLEGGSYYFVTLYAEFGNFVFSGYDPTNCQSILRTEATITDIMRWLKYHPSMLHKPMLLRPENYDKLVSWLIDELQICTWCGMKIHDFYHHRDGTVMCLKGHKMEEISAQILQGMWKKRKARLLIVDMIRRVYAKRFDPASGYFYYVNTITNEVKWEKPVILRSLDIAVKEGWERMVDANGTVYYFHAMTGRTSWFSLEAAAKLVQRNFRKSRSKDFRIHDFSEIVKALRFQRDAEDNYASNPTRLSSMLNYALLLHTIRFDYDTAGVLYEKCKEMAPHNPTVNYAYSVWLLATVQYPREKTWVDAQQNIISANLNDSRKNSFDVAISSFFHWSIVSNPTSAGALLNWALIQQCIKNDYYQAERFYKKALHADPIDKRTLRNYADFLRERQDKNGIYYDGTPTMESMTAEDIKKKNNLNDKKKKG